MSVNFLETAAASASLLQKGESIEARGLVQNAAPRQNPDPTFCLGKGEAKETRCRRLIELSVKILANKAFALLVIVGVGIWLLVIPAVTGDLGANPPERLLHRTGEIAIWILGAVLSLSPLRVLFPRSRLVNALNRHRRVIGVSACVYGLMHFGFHLLYEGDTQAIARSFSKPFIWFGLAGLSTLVVLAVTSNNFSIRKLGGKNWKRLHRLAYVAAAVLIYHQAIAGKGHWHIARWLLFSLLALQIARITKLLLKKFNRKNLSHQSAKRGCLPTTATLNATTSEL
jgi:sulfoxide reductase heme-binding subunit YedZ